MPKTITICWFGIYNPDFGRNRIYMKGLKDNGVSVIECRDASPGLLKFWRLWKKHYTLRGKYDALVVGYPGHLLVPFAKLLSKKPVIADLLGSLADAEQHSHAPSKWRRMKSRFIDRLAVRFADIVLLESEAQKKYFEKRFGPSSKYHVLYTGADDALFCRDGPAMVSLCIILFRGRLTPESGIGHILSAAAFLKGEENIRFRILGGGQLLLSVKERIARQSLTNVELISERLSETELRKHMSEAGLSLGQFEDNPRLSRTIPHKAYESLAMGIPYLSGEASAIREIIRDEENGFLVPLADPRALSAKIQGLAGNHEALAAVGAAGKREFDARFSPHALGRELSRVISEASS